MRIHYANALLIGTSTSSLAHQRIQVPLAAVHHAAETYLVPDVLKKAYGISTCPIISRLTCTHTLIHQGHPPAVALHAVQARFKRESYRGSEFAPRILTENGIKVIMKVCVGIFRLGAHAYADHHEQSDHPLVDSRFLLYEAQQAHYVRTPVHDLLFAVTNPAFITSMDYPTM